MPDLPSCSRRPGLGCQKRVESGAAAFFHGAQGASLQNAVSASVIRFAGDEAMPPSFSCGCAIESGWCFIL